MGSRRLVKHPWILLITLALVIMVVHLGSGTHKPDNKASENFKGRVISLEERYLKSGQASIILDVDFPPGYYLTAEAPSKISWECAEDEIVRIAPGKDNSIGNNVMFPFKMDCEAIPGRTELIFDMVVYLCEKESQACLTDPVRIILPIVVGDEGQPELKINIEADVPGRSFDI